MARILVIEDEKMARYTVHQILDRAGHEIEEAENGAIGLDQHRAVELESLGLGIVDDIGAVLHLNSPPAHDDRYGR